jgi:hypothetical protein
VADGIEVVRVHPSAGDFAALLAAELGNVEEQGDDSGEGPL